jgi:hypothetical protein
MAEIKISELEPGMVLGESVYNASGGLLLKDGALVTEKHISIFKKWGVNRVRVRRAGEETGTPVSRYAALDPGEVRELDERLESRFRWVEDDPVMLEVLRVTRKLFMKQMLESSRPDD